MVRFTSQFNHQRATFLPVGPVAVVVLEGRILVERSSDLDPRWMELGALLLEALGAALGQALYWEMSWDLQWDMQWDMHWATSGIGQRGA
jgi:hypothetical protein